MAGSERDRERSALLSSIARTIRDYRQGQVHPLTPVHVNRWVSQFDEVDQLPILQEIDRLLKRFYFSRSRVKDCLRSFIRQCVVGTAQPRRSLADTEFLRVQRKGDSQRDLLDVVDEILREDYGLGLDRCGRISPVTFVYIDDCIYTGNRLRYDLTSGQSEAAYPRDPAWITTQAPYGCTLKIYVLASHSEGERYAMKLIGEAAAEKAIEVDGYRAVVVANCRHQGEAECLWPRVVTGCTEVDEYVNGIRVELASKGLPDILFRPAWVPQQERLFSSPQARDTLERAFLVKGVGLRKHSDKPSVRPLGFEVLRSLGFGTPVVTYRNIANNAPLVLWWRGSDWYPLFPRRDSSSHAASAEFEYDDFDDVPF